MGRQPIYDSAGIYQLRRHYRVIRITWRLLFIKTEIILLKSHYEY